LVPDGAERLSKKPNSHATAAELFNNAIMGNRTANQFRSTLCYRWVVGDQFATTSSAGDSMKRSASLS
jgi:hypothetical protein